MVIAFAIGFTIGPPTESEYPVEPVGVETIIPSAEMLKQIYRQSIILYQSFWPMPFINYNIINRKKSFLISFGTFPTKRHSIFNKIFTLCNSSIKHLSFIHTLQEILACQNLFQELEYHNFYHHNLK